MSSFKGVYESNIIPVGITIKVNREFDKRKINNSLIYLYLLDGVKITHNSLTDI